MHVVAFYTSVLSIAHCLFLCLWTGALDQSDCRIPSGQSGRLSVRHTLEAKCDLDASRHITDEAVFSQYTYPSPYSIFGNKDESLHLHTKGYIVEDNGFNSGGLGKLVVLLLDTL